MMPRRTWIFILVYAFILSASFLLFLARFRFSMPDYQVFHTAGERFLAVETLYRASDGHWQFKYMPFSAAFFALPSLLPLFWGKLIWFSITILSSMSVIGISCRLINSSRRSIIWPLLLSSLVMLRFFYREIELGQSNVVMIALILIMLILLLDQKDKTAGLILGLAITLKPYAIIFLPYLLLKRRWRAAGISFGFLLLALGAPMILYGWKGNLELIRQWGITISESTPGLLTNSDNISLFGMYAKWIGIEALSLVYGLALFTALILGLAFLAAMFRRRSANHPLTTKSSLIIESAILLILMPLLSPQGWDYVLLGGTLGVMYLLVNRMAFPTILRWVLYFDLALVTFTIYDIMGRSLYHIFMQASVLTICFLYLIALLLWNRFIPSPRLEYHFQKT